jgi:hypothetical protein
MALPKLNETPNKDGDMQVVDVNGTKQLIKINENIEKLTDSILNLVQNSKTSNTNTPNAPTNTTPRKAPSNSRPPRVPNNQVGKKPGSFTKGFVSGLLGIEDAVNYHTADDKEKIMDQREYSDAMYGFNRRYSRGNYTPATDASVDPMPVAPEALAVIPATPNLPEPEKKQETVSIGGQKLDPKNPKDAKLIEQINKQLVESTPTEKVIASPTENLAPATEKNTTEANQSYASDELNTSIGKLQTSFDNLAASLNTRPNNDKSLETVLQETFAKLDSTLKGNQFNAESYKAGYIEPYKPTYGKEGRSISPKVISAISTDGGQVASPTASDIKVAPIATPVTQVAPIATPVSAGGIEPNEDSKKETDKQQDRELLAQAIADKLGEVLGSSGGIGLPDIGDVIPDGLGKSSGKAGKAGKAGKILSGLSKAAKFGGPLAAALTVGESAYAGYSDYNDAETQLAKGEITADEAKTKKSGAVGKGVGGAAGGLAGAATGALAGAAMGSMVGPVGTVVGTLIGGAIGAFGGSELGKMGGESIGRELSKPEYLKPKVDVSVPETKGQKLSQITNDNSELKSSADSKVAPQQIISSSVTNNNNKDNYIQMPPRPRNDMNSIERYLDKVR